MANTIPQGRTAPASTPTITGKKSPHQIDLVALHGEAVNACAMSRWYAAHRNYKAAARKLRQGLTALRRLQALEVSA